MDAEDPTAEDDTGSPVVGYVYLLSEVSNGKSGSARYEEIARIAVDVTHYGRAALAAGARPWAIEHLRDIRCDAGLYYVELSGIDADGAIGTDNLADAYLPWSGSGLLATPA